MDLDVPSRRCSLTPPLSPRSSGAHQFLIYPSSLSKIRESEVDNLLETGIRDLPPALVEGDLGGCGQPVQLQEGPRGTWRYQKG